ncbi:GerAB/ArcD/ProY family transporter [Ruminococcus sp. OA3]|uniref:GerAB/ArcD/ProY family transporter n=1 Tax=Ruminococcus sp. OA3 TaxID=2914164 RepID=UPI001F06C757|nr:GerAB/ArcD/ProY family transporter [Ruminococcus sp. OA3]
MFSDNHRISRRQLGRQLALGLSGTFLLVIPRLPQLYGVSGIISCVIGLLALWVYLFFMVRNTATSKSLRQRMSRPAYMVVSVFFLSYLVLSGGYLVRTVAGMIKASLVTEYSVWVIAGLLILTAVIGTGSDIQRRARIGEVSALPVIGGLFLLLVLAAFQGDGIPSEMIQRTDAGTVLRGAYDFFCAFSITGVIPFLMSNVERPQGSVKALYIGSGTAAVLAVGGLCVMQAVFGVYGMQEKEFPVTALMSAVSFPGNFLDRFDIIWMIFLLFALFYAVGTILFYSHHLVNDRDNLTVRLIFAVLVFAAAFVEWNGGSIDDLYPMAVRYLYMPLFVIFGLFVCRIRRKA